jgi:hypothetical protein
MMKRSRSSSQAWTPIGGDKNGQALGVQLFLTPRWTLIAKFEGEFAPGSQTYAGTGTLRYSW